jgi:hypothetical protein
MEPRRRTVTQSYVGGHNTPPHSHKKDFKLDLDDVMGGLVIEIPLGK